MRNVNDFVFFDFMRLLIIFFIYEMVGLWCEWSGWESCLWWEELIVFGGEGNFGVIIWGWVEFIFFCGWEYGWFICRGSNLRRKVLWG